MRVINLNRVNFGTHCLICGHDNVRELNRDVIAGGTLQAVAKKYGVAVTSLQRHRIQCLGIPRAADAVNVSAKLADIRAKLPKADEIGDFYAVLRAQLAEIVDDALSKGQAMMAVTAIDKIRLNLDSVSRIAGRSIALPAIPSNLHNLRLFPPVQQASGHLSGDCAQR